MSTLASTIYALSSAPGRAGVAVIRVSGPAAGAALDAIAGTPRTKPRYAALRKLRHPKSGELLDEALVLFFAGPRSETGEDLCELHVHGSRAVISAVLEALSMIPGCQPAEAGGFARRAFHNGKLDLTALEGLADLIDAETEGQRAQAVAQAGGALVRLYDRWRKEVIEVLALIEAAIDFSDEGDVSGWAVTESELAAMSLIRTLEGHLDGAHRGEILRSGFQVVLLGAPNAGKSSLLNALARRDVAIVSPEAGTTRDIVEVRLDLCGVPVVVSDTAGLRDQAGAVEQEGMRRALERAAAADLVLLLSEAGQPGSQITPLDLPKTAKVLRLATKIDIAAADAMARACDHSISSVTGDGLPALIDAIAGASRAQLGTTTEPPPTQARHRHHIGQAIEHLQAFLENQDADLAVRAEDLRLTANAIGRLTGRVDPEEVLGAIFGRFCIGK